MNKGDYGRIGWCILNYICIVASIFLYGNVMNGNERQKRNVELSIATCKLTEPGRLE